MAVESHGIDLLPVITLLAAGVIAAPLFKRLGLGSVLGYLAGGIAIGPFGLRVFTDPRSIPSWNSGLRPCVRPASTWAIANTGISAMASDSAPVQVPKDG